MEFLKILKNQKQIFIQNLEKAYTEGIYSDTPQNRKLGRVGMSYKKEKELKEKKSELKETLSYIGNTLRVTSVKDFASEYLDDNIDTLKYGESFVNDYVALTSLVMSPAIVSIFAMSKGALKLADSAKKLIKYAKDGNIGKKFKEISNKLRSFVKGLNNKSKVPGPLSKRSKKDVEKINKKEGKDLTSDYVSPKRKKELIKLLDKNNISYEKKKIKGEDCYYFKIGDKEYGLEDNNLFDYSKDYSDNNSKENYENLIKIFKINNEKIKEISKKEGKKTIEQMKKIQEELKPFDEKLNKLKWSVAKDKQFKTRNGNPATNRISLNIERAEGPNSEDFNKVVDNIYIDTPKGRIYKISSGASAADSRYAIPHPEYDKTKSPKENSVTEYTDVDAKAALDFINGKDYYEVKRDSYNRGDKYNKLMDNWQKYLNQK